jgi:hypothetical protein
MELIQFINKETKMNINEIRNMSGLNNINEGMNIDDAIKEFDKIMATKFRAIKSLYSASVGIREISDTNAAREFTNSIMKLGNLAKAIATHEEKRLMASLSADEQKAFREAVSKRHNDKIRAVISKPLRSE